MFTEQNGIFRRLRNYVEASVASTLARLSNCAAPLTHRAPVSLDASLPEGSREALLEVNNRPIQPQTANTVPGENGGANGWDAHFHNHVRIDGWLVGAFKLIKITVQHQLVSDGPSYDSYCEGRVCDLDGTYLSPDTIRIYLPRTTTADPNVRVGEIIKSSVLPDGRLIACSEVLDGKVGDVRMIYVADPTTPLDYTAAAGVRGWRVADGTNGTVDLSGRVPYGWLPSDTLYDTIGEEVAAGGSINAASDLTHAAAGGGPATVTVNAAAAGITFGTHPAEETVGTPTSTPPFNSVTADSHSHTGSIAHSAIAAGLANHTIAQLESSLSVSDARTHGTVLLFLQRIS